MLAAAPPKAAVAAHAHLDEDERAVALAHDQVDLATTRAPPARDPIIAPHQPRCKMGERTRFGGIAERFRRGRGSSPRDVRRRSHRVDGAKLVEAAALAAAGQQYPAAAL